MNLHWFYVRSLVVESLVLTCLLWYNWKVLCKVYGWLSFVTIRYIRFVEPLVLTFLLWYNWTLLCKVYGWLSFVTIRYIRFVEPLVLWLLHCWHLFRVLCKYWTDNHALILFTIGYQCLTFMVQLTTIECS